MGYRMRASMTNKRMAWLLLLEKGPAVRDGWKQVPFQCMRLGWTRWVDPRPTKPGEPWLEELTDLGRGILQEHRKPTSESGE